MKSGWVTKKLGEVCEIIMGASPDSKSYNIMRDGLPFYQGKTEFGAEYPTPVKWCSEPVKIAQSGDVLLSVRAPIGPVNFANEKCCIGRGLSALRFEGEQRYLYYFLQASETELDARGTGTTFKCISGQSLRSVPIPIPPLAEQKRIVAKIDAAFEKIDKLKANAERNLANAKDLFQSALDEAMRPKDGWVEKRLGEVANIRVGPFGSSLHKADYVENGVPLVNPCHMKDSKIADKISTQVSHNKAESLKEYRLRAGDIVFARRGEIGRLAFVSEKEDGYLCGTGSLFARFRERFDIQFLYFFFSSKSFVERLEMLSTGTTMKSINSSALESMSFSVPPMNEQQQLAQQFDSLAEKIKILEQNYSKQIADCVEMRQAVLREAFEGRL